MNTGNGLISNQPSIPAWFSIPLYLIASFLLFTLLSVFLLPLKLLPTTGSIYYQLAKDLTERGTMLISVTACAILFIKKVHKLPFSELGLSFKRRGIDCVSGFVFAIVFYAFGFGVSLGLGVVEVTSAQLDIVALLGSFLVFFIAAAAEEVMMRGYVQGVLMRSGVHRFVALLIASALFSSIHLFNPNISPFALFNLFLAGVMLGASFLYTRNLWFPIWLHTTWNWMQGSVLGYEISGVQFYPSVLTLSLSENHLLNGGDFGFEGSAICTVLLIISTGLIIGYYERKLLKASDT